MSSRSGSPVGSPHDGSAVDPSAEGSPPIGNGTRWVFRLAGLFTLLAVGLGSVVCATDSGFECGNWPGCTDASLLPKDQMIAWLYRNPWIEMVHRTSAILVGPFAILAALLILRRPVPRLVKVLPWITVAGAIVAGYVGRGLVLGVSYPTWVAAADLGSALLAMAAMTTATIALERSPFHWRPGVAGRMAWTALAILFVMHLAAFWVAGPKSYTRCLSWPVWELVAGDGNPVLQWTRFVLTVVAAGCVVAAVRAARRTPALRATANAVAILLAVVLVLSLVVRFTHLADLGAFYSLATVGLLFALVLLGARDSMRTITPSNTDERDLDRASVG